MPLSQICGHTVLLSTDEKYCPILCRETNKWIEAPCGHIFDSEAFVTWLKQPEGPESCPLCREPFCSFDKQAQRRVSSTLVMIYTNTLGSQYIELWKTDRKSIIRKFWLQVNVNDIYTLIRRFSRGAAVSSNLHELFCKVLEGYQERLRQAVTDLVQKDVAANLKYHVPPRYQTQLNREAEMYLQYTTTNLVPEFFLKWWHRTFLPRVLEAIDEMFLSVVL